MSFQFLEIHKKAREKRKFLIRNFGHAVVVIWTVFFRDFGTFLFSGFGDVPFFPICFRWTLWMWFKVHLYIKQLTLQLV